MTASASTKEEIILTVLYVTLQGDVNPRTLSRELEAHGIRQWLYLGEDSAWRARAESAVSPGIPRVSIADLLDEMSWKLRRPYIDWIGELSQLNDSLDWWASELAAKNPYYQLYIRICLLAVAKRLITAGFDRSSLLICSSPALFAEVLQLASQSGVGVRRLSAATPEPRGRTLTPTMHKYLGAAYRRLRRAGGYLLRPGQWLSQNDAYDRRSLLAERAMAAAGPFEGDDTVLLFTWVDRRSFAADGSYQDPHLGPLPDMLKQRGYRVAYVARILHTVPFDEMVERMLQTGEQFYVPQFFISDEDREACRQRAESFQPLMPTDSTVGDVPVYRLAREQIESHRATLAGTLTYERLIANFVCRGVRPHQIIYPCEGHSYEQALLWSVRHYMPQTRIVAYENVNFSRLALSMYPAQSEYGLRPLPDRMVTNGPLYGEVLLAENLPPDLVKTGCALRHNYLWEKPVYGAGENPAADGDAVRVLVATAIGFGDTVELVAKAVRAFGGDAGYQVIVKCHPFLNAKLVMRDLSELIQQDNVQFVTTAMDELLPSMHILLYTYTSVCYEALQHGVAPVFVRAENFLNMDQLEATPDVRWEATTAADLRRAARQITNMNAEERCRWRERAHEVVRKALAPVTPQCVEAFLV